MIQRLFSFPIYPILEDKTLEDIEKLKNLGIENLVFLLDDGLDCEYDESKIEIKTMLGKKVIYNASLGIPEYTIEIMGNSLQIKPFKNQTSSIVTIPLEENSLDYLLFYYNL